MKKFTYFLKAMILLNISCNPPTQKDVARTNPDVVMPSDNFSRFNNSSNPLMHTNDLTKQQHSKMLKEYFPLSIGNKWTYQCTIMEGMIPKYAFIGEVEKAHPTTGNAQGDLLLFNANAPSAESCIETYSISQIDNQVDAFVIDVSSDIIINRRCPIFQNVDRMWWRYTSNGVWENIRGQTQGEGILIFDLIAYLKPNEGTEDMSPGRQRKIFCTFSYDTIIVPVGRFFNCLKNVTTQLGGEENKTIKTISYYARDVGLIKEIQYDYSDCVTYTLELIEYHVR